MRLSQAWIVARHDLGFLRRRRSILYAVIAYPLGVSIGVPVDLCTRSEGILRQGARSDLVSPGPGVGLRGPSGLGSAPDDRS